MLQKIVHFCVHTESYGWWFGVVVTSFVAWTELLYIEAG